MEKKYFDELLSSLEDAAALVQGDAPWAGSVKAGSAMAITDGAIHPTTGQGSGPSPRRFSTIRIRAAARIQ